MMVLTTCKGWFQNLLKSRGASSTQKEKEKNNNTCSISSVPLSSSASPLHSSLPPGTTPSKPQHAKTVLTSELRWKRKYDVFVGHSSSHTDTEEAKRLVLFLEAAPRCLRCFLWQRDACPGAAISTEFCQAVQNSHIQVLLITPDFLQDDWCNYVMHQALADGPMSNRMIPLLQNISYSQYPQELKFYFYVDLSKNPDKGYSTINKAVFSYLENLVNNEKKSYCSGAS